MFEMFQEWRVVPPVGLAGMMGGMGPPPGSNGADDNDFMRGARGTPAELLELPIADGETLFVGVDRVGDCALTDPDEEDDEDMHGVDVRLAGADGPVGYTLLSLCADDRASSLAGAVELIWRAVLTACVSETGSSEGAAQADLFNNEGKPRRPEQVVVLESAVLEALAPMLGTVGIRTRLLADGGFSEFSKVLEETEVGRMLRDAAIRSPSRVGGGAGPNRSEISGGVASKGACNTPHRNASALVYCAV